jgi:DNA-binding GntR family transcriptional regulator
MPVPIRLQIREVLQDRILGGTLPAGTVLQPAAVATELGTSATPAREALIELARDGLLEARPNRGFAVAALSSTEVRELYPLVGALEAFALRTTVHSTRQLDALSALNTRFAAATNPRTRHALDTKWHELLLAPCPNASGQHILRDLRRRLRRYEIAYLRHDGRFPASAGQHERILAALRGGRRANAAALLEQNWQQGVEALGAWVHVVERAS